MDSLRENGFKPALARPYILAADCWFDFRYGTDTNKFSPLNRLDIPSRNKEHGKAYMATRIMPLRKLFRQIKASLPPKPVLLDFGCGKGRVLMIAAEFGFRAVRGVEFAPELCVRARKNCAAFKSATGSATEFEIIESDVVDYLIRPDENVFFFYNPFDAVVLNEVLVNITISLRKAPRAALIIYCNPCLDSVIEQGGNFQKLSDHCFWGYRLSVFKAGGEHP